MHGWFKMRSIQNDRRGGKVGGAGSFALLAVILCMHGWLKRGISRDWEGGIHGILLKRSKLRRRRYGGSLESMPLYHTNWRFVHMYSCIFSILWEIRRPAPTCQAFSCGYIRRSEGSPLGKYRGKRFICMYIYIGWEGGDKKNKKKTKMYQEGVWRLSRRQRGCPGTR